MKSLGLPMGPFELMDYVGIDIAYPAPLYRAETKVSKRRERNASRYIFRERPPRSKDQEFFKNFS